MTKPGDLITKAKAFKASDVTYKPPKVNSRGGKSVQLQLGGHPLILQIPLMLTWGVNERVDEQTGRVSYDLSLQFEKGQGKRSVEKFQQALQDLQEKILDDAVKNSRAWFGKSSTSRQVLEALMYPILRYPKKKDDSGDYDYERNPTLKLKIPFWEGKFNLELYNMARKPIYLPPKAPGAVVPQGDKTPMDLVPKASHLNGLVACTGVWMAAGRFGVTWKLLQACVQPPLRLLGSATCHVAYDSDDEAAMEQLSRNQEQQQKTGPSYDADDSDDEETDAGKGPTFSSDEEAEEARPPTPPPAPKKKKVVRRRKKKTSA